MKTFQFLFALILCATMTIQAQIPQGFSYQSVLRDSSGSILADKPVTVVFVIKKDSNSVYSEDHETSTNAFGLVTLTVGQGTPLLGDFSTIDWSSGGYTMQVYLNFGYEWLDMGTSPLLTVPFAMTAGTALNTGPWAPVTDGIEYTNGMVHINNGAVTYPLLVQGGGTVWMPKLQNKIIPGNNQGGAIYFGATDANGTNPTAAIEASWGESNVNPTFGIGCVRDNFGGRIVMTHNGQISFINKGVERLRVSDIGTVFANGYLGSADGFGTNFIELRSNGSTPFIDFSNDLSVDHDARLILLNDDMLLLEGCNLAVSGTVSSKEILVTVSGFPDYVFREDYDLMPLHDVDAFIKANGHLPNMPKEADALVNGIELGEMNVKLVEKVEELTLHTIAQQKLIEEQAAILKSLQEQIDKLQRDDY